MFGGIVCVWMPARRATWQETLEHEVLEVSSIYGRHGLSYDGELPHGGHESSSKLQLRRSTSIRSGRSRLKMPAARATGRLIQAWQRIAWTAARISGAPVTDQDEPQINANNTTNSEVRAR
jgi:hypothetical protein